MDWSPRVDVSFRLSLFSHIPPIPCCAPPPSPPHRRDHRRRCAVDDRGAWRHPLRDAGRHQRHAARVGAAGSRVHIGCGGGASGRPPCDMALPICCIPLRCAALHRFQLWVNLPKSQKMCKPRYQDITASEIPVVDDGAGASGAASLPACLPPPNPTRGSPLLRNAAAPYLLRGS